MLTPFINRLGLKGFLSFAPDAEPLELQPLNVLIGPNGSGKSNVIEAVELLRATPFDFAAAIRDGGGAAEWLWKGQAKPSPAIVDIQLDQGTPTGRPLRYRLEFSAVQSRVEVLDEAIEEVTPQTGKADVFFYYRFQRGRPAINVRRGGNWNLVCCGGRGEAFNKFVRSTSATDLVVLLVDAEGAVQESPRAHLHSRDAWDLSQARDDVVHLMIQVMKTWIVADPGTVAAYYGRGFARKPLSKARDLESVPKATIAKTLEQATRGTKKGDYHKVRHASDLLAKIDRLKVGQRCPSCQRLFDTLGGLIASHHR